MQTFQVHKVFLERLTKKQSTWTPDQTLGDTFLLLSERFDTYSNYLDNYPATIAIYRKNLNQNPAFWAFKEHFDGQNSNRTKFFELLVQPLKRIGTLHTLISSLLFYTSPKHSDHALLKQSSAEFSRLRDVISQTQDQYSHLTSLKQLEQEITGCPLLTDTTRGILTQLQVYRVKSVVDDSGKPHTFPPDKEFPYYQKYKLFLLDDSLMVTRVLFEVEPFGEGVRERVSFVSAAALTAVRVRNADHENRFVLYTPQAVYLFECASAEDMRQWAEVVNVAIINAPKLVVPNIYMKPAPAIKTMG